MNRNITHTAIGRDYGWDRLSDVDGDMLANNHPAMLRIVENPDQFPDADFAEAERKLVEIEDFLVEYAEDLIVVERHKQEALDA